jgi:hypothetical protein
VFIARRSDQPKTRLTLDRVVTASVRPPPNGLYAEPDIALIPLDMMVLELKFDGTCPAWMRDLCCRLRLRAEPVSKFGLSVALGLRADHPREVRFVTPRTVRNHSVAGERLADDLAASVAELEGAQTPPVNARRAPSRVRA